MPAATHPVWTFLIGLLLVLVLWLRLAYGYNNGFDPSPDIKTILAMIGTYFGGITLQKALGRKGDE